MGRLKTVEFAGETGNGEVFVDSHDPYDYYAIKFFYHDPLMHLFLGHCLLA